MIKNLIKNLVLLFCNTSLPFNSLPNTECSKLFNAATFCSKSFPRKTSFPFKKLYLLTFPDDKAEILAVYLSNYIELCFAHVVIDCFNILTNTHL